MTFTILTLFPDLIRTFFETSIAAKAADRGLVTAKIVNIRDFATDRHATCDNPPYGGGPGMVLLPEPLGKALDSIATVGQRVVYPTPSGRLFDANYARALSKTVDLVIICGRYEGIDQRIVDKYVDDEISIGDYVLSSGEIGALTIVDAVIRLLDGVINEDSLREESFAEGLLEYPHYTRPEEYDGMRVPEVLLSGHHARIRDWRLQESLKKTKRNRPDLFERVDERVRHMLVDDETSPQHSEAEER